MKDLNKELQERKAKHLYRTRRISDGPQQPEMIVDGKKVTSFCSNDYLGLANHPQVKQAFIDGVNKYGAGSGAAHLVNGHSRAHHQLEEKLAEFTGYPRALLFSTGYMANLGITQALLGRGDVVLEDRLNHASLLDGGRLSGARLMRYQHNAVDDLENKLSGLPDNKKEKIVLTDGVFSMDGDVANLPVLSDVCANHEAWFMVDDAHGFGVLGANGRGSPEHCGLTPHKLPIYMATLGKALGTAGAFIAGDEALIETLIQKARTYIYTTAMPAAIAEATIISLELVKNNSSLRETLNNNIRYFRRCCEQQIITITASQTAIQPVIIGDEEKTVRVSEKLFNSGILVTAIRPPTVPEGTSRLRVTLSSSHTHEQIDRLVAALVN